MKLAEALITRSDLQRRVDELKTRLIRSAKVQEGESPHENPEELLQELDRCTLELTTIVQKIYRTNAEAKVEGVGSLADALAERDVLKLKSVALANFLEEAAFRHERYGSAEIKIFSTVDVKGLQKKLDDLSAELRKLEMKIQEKNWLVEID